MHIQLQIVSKFLLFVNFRGSNSAEGGTYQLADMYRRGPNPLADMDRGVHIRGESKSAVTPDWNCGHVIACCVLIGCYT
jgi:hypothetical protein